VSARLRRIVTERPSSFAVGLAVMLLIANVVAQPDFIAPNQIAPTLGTMAPFVIVGMASTLAFLSGGGGIDLSIAPLMGLVNIVLVTVLFGTSFGSPVLAVPILLALGALVGALNGVMVARLRYPPVIATLGTFFVLAGLDLRLVPNPVTAGDNWTNHLAGSIGPMDGVLSRLDPLVSEPVVLSHAEFRQLVAFVRNGLLDPRALPQNLRKLVPSQVPSAHATLTFEFPAAHRPLE